MCLEAVRVGDVYYRNESLSSGYRLAVGAPSCHYFDPKHDEWRTEGCVVGPATNLQTTECLCSHLTVFAAGFFVPPNTIDFDFVFSHADFDKNLGIYASLIIVYVLYFVLLIWAKNRDDLDLTKVN